MGGGYWVNPVEFNLAVDKENAIDKDLFLVLTNPNAPVIDTESPVLPTMPTMILEYSKNLNTSPENTLKPEATDNIDSNPVETYEESSTEEMEGVGKYNYTITRTWTATDASGNSSTGIHIIKVQDTTPPEITGETEFFFEFSTVLNTSPEEIGYPTFSDNGEVADSTYNDESTKVMDGTANQVNYVETRTWTITDVVGNEGIPFIQTITVTDNTAPDFETPQDITIEEIEGVGTDVTGYPVNIQDNSELNVDMRFEDSVLSDSDDKKEIEREWTGADVAGNEKTKSQHITVNKTVTGIYDPTQTENHDLEVFKEGEIVSLNYFADANETVRIQLIDIGTGRVVSTFEDQVMKGENILTLPNYNEFYGAKLVRVIDEDESNIQTQKFVN